MQYSSPLQFWVLRGNVSPETATSKPMDAIETFTMSDAPTGGSGNSVGVGMGVGVAVAGGTEGVAGAGVALEEVSDATR